MNPFLTLPSMVVAQINFGVSMLVVVHCRSQYFTAHRCSRSPGSDPVCRTSLQYPAKDVDAPAVSQVAAKAVQRRHVHPQPPNYRYCSAQRPQTSFCRLRQGCRSCAGARRAGRGLANVDRPAQRLAGISLAHSPHEVLFGGQIGIVWHPELTRWCATVDIPFLLCVSKNLAQN